MLKKHPKPAFRLSPIEISFINFIPIMIENLNPQIEESIFTLNKAISKDNGIKSHLKTLLRPQEISSLSMKFRQKAFETSKEVLKDFGVLDLKETLVHEGVRSFCYSDILVREIEVEQLKDILSASVIENSMTPELEAQTEKEFETKLASPDLENDSNSENLNDNLDLQKDAEKLCEKDKDSQKSFSQEIEQEEIIPEFVDNHDQSYFGDQPISLSIIIKDNLDSEINSNDSNLYELNYTSLQKANRHAVVEIPLSMMLEIQNMVFDNRIENSCNIILLFFF